MGVPNRQIGWSQESNLLWYILSQLKRLTSIIFSLKEAATPKYKVYTALLTQSGTSDPTIVVLENNIGNIVWERDDVGRYSATLINAFTTNKTFINLSNNFSFTGPNFQTSWVNSSIFSEDSFQIRTIRNGSPGDNMLLNTPIEIRVYN